MSTPASIRLIEHVIKRFSHRISAVGAIIGILHFDLFVNLDGFRSVPG